MASDESKFNEIHVRGGFSNRNGFDKISTKMQIDCLDAETRATILNELTLSLSLFYPKNDENKYAKKMMLYVNILKNVYHEIIDSKVYEDVLNFQYRYIYEKPLSPFIQQSEDYLKNTILYGRWDEVLTLLEYILSEISSNNKDLYQLFVSHINEIFEKECVGYRLVDGLFVQITDTIEISEIENALGSDDVFSSCKTQIRKSLNFLSDRNNPDYKNSIKESINAVESVCKIITGKDKATLSDSLVLLMKNGIEIHPALQKAIEKFYAYASDAGGVRHAEKESESTIPFEDAKLTLVICCSIVNYLIVKYGKIEEAPK